MGSKRPNSGLCQQALGLTGQTFLQVSLIWFEQKCMYANIFPMSIRPRWELFVNSLKESLLNGTTFDEQGYASEVFSTIEDPFTKSQSLFSCTPHGMCYLGIGEFKHMLIMVLCFCRGAVQGCKGNAPEMETIFDSIAIIMQ